MDAQHQQAVDEQNSSPHQEAAAGGDGGGDASTGNAAAQGQSAAAQQADEDKEFLDKMRGWLMTVATLFVGIAFQAATHPPEWIPKDWTRGLKSNNPPPNPTISTVQALAVLAYTFLNTVSFAMALTVVVMLLLMKKSPPGRTLTLVTFLVPSIALFAAGTFAFAAAYDTIVFIGVCCTIVLYVAITVSFLLVYQAE